jgi:hypothetical protein
MVRDTLDYETATAPTYDKLDLASAAMNAARDANVDGTFPQWEAVAERFTPTDDIDAPLFPDLLPGAPIAAMERTAKAAPGAVTWQAAGDAFIGSVEGDEGLSYISMRGALGYTGRKGFEHHVGGHDEAMAYLLDLAAQRGLPSPVDLECACWQIEYDYGPMDLAAANSQRPFGKVKFEGPKLDIEAGRIVGLTVAATHERYGWSETVEDWETLDKRTVRHDGGPKRSRGPILSRCRPTGHNCTSSRKAMSTVRTGTATLSRITRRLSISRKSSCER